MRMCCLQLADSTNMYAYAGLPPREFYFLVCCSAIFECTMYAGVFLSFGPQSNVLEYGES